MECLASNTTPAMLRTADRVYGVVADSPGYWDERDGFYIPPPLPSARHPDGEPIRELI